VKAYSTAQVSKLLKIGRQTLHRWIKEVPTLAPRKTSVGGVIVRMWGPREVENLRKYKQKNYRKGRGRKPRPRR
jgi:hypothetical protein